MRYLDVCSGISAPTMAWKPLGWKAACFAEIEPAPRAVLAHHYPDVPLRGDFTEIRGTEHGPVDLLVGGTPCQSFSVAGLRGGLGDDRGNLALEFARLADRARPRWVVWENVPGVLSSNGGRDFGSILGALGELGYGVAYRVLDAQHFGVPQRRRRVFVVGCLGSWTRAAAVLFERHSLSGHPAPRRGAAAAAGAVAAFNWAAGGKQTTLGYDDSGLSPTLSVGQFPAIAFKAGQGDKARGWGLEEECAPTLGAACSGTQQAPAVHYGDDLRKLTPRECERLQGFPDDFTLVPHRGKPMADGPRYKMLGNSMAVPVLRWIGERIAMVDAIIATSHRSIAA